LLFIALLPFGILSFLQADHLQELSYLVIPLTALIAGVFVIMERTGAANEDPFENEITDVPLSALCRSIERDLKEMIQDPNLPPPLKPENGYLF